MSARQGVLLVNLGSPDQPDVPGVRRYLAEFLMDERVLDMPYAARWLLVHGLILPFRPRKTAEAYHKIWWPEGAPLVVISRRLQAALRSQVSLPIALAMRYQHPSIEQGLRELLAQKVEEIILVSLYPHYAQSTTGTVEARVREVLAALAPGVKLKIVPPFYDDPDYIGAMVSAADRFLRGDYDHLLFSYHGLPERHLHKADPTGGHCLKSPDCCTVASPAHATCYRHQTLATVAAFARRAGLPEGKYSVAFQSRLGRQPWLKPYTDLELARLAKAGAKKLLVLCPSFVADCLETLEEIGVRGRETFVQAGGTELVLLPCLNAHPDWVAALAKMIQRQAG